MSEKQHLKHIGKAARERRIALGMTQEDAAEKIGVTVEFYSRIERGKANPSLSNFMRMAIAFRVGLDHLAGFHEEGAATEIIEMLTIPPPSDDRPAVKRLERRLRSADDQLIDSLSEVLTVLEKLWVSGQRHLSGGLFSARTGKKKRKLRKKKAKKE